MNKYLTEMIGTFFLVFTIGCTVIGGGSGVIPPLAIGAVLMVMIYAGGHVSGGHYNPAVTFGVWLRGRATVRDMASYWVFQLIGAFLATLAVQYLRPGAEVDAMRVQTGPAALAEFLFTFALVYVVINSATSKATSGNSFYGLAIGMTVMAGAFAVGNVSGGAFNPAVVVAGSVLGLFAWGNAWYYILAQLAGGAAAALSYKAFNRNDK